MVAPNHKPRQCAGCGNALIPAFTKRPEILDSGFCVACFHIIFGKEELPNQPVMYIRAPRHAGLLN